MNSWLILVTSLIGYLIFKQNIKSEYTELEKFFMEGSGKYAGRIPENFPFLKISKPK